MQGTAPGLVTIWQKMNANCFEVQHAQDDHCGC